ncbi:DNA polymerase IV [Spirochaetota bacterium]
MGITAIDCRKIIHIDMDAYYASVEQRDNPELRGKPVIVGGNPNSRGVVAACSYEARKFGIHSAMSSSRAHRQCPQAVFLRGRFDVYKEVSQQIRDIFFKYTDLVEPMSLDEAYLDVTQNKKGSNSATEIAKKIRKEIYNVTGLTASAGVSFNKFLAKVASDFNKPDGITVITPHKASHFIDNLPIGKFHGIGKVTEKKMRHMKITNGKDLKKITRTKLIEMFGKVGGYYYDIANCSDKRPVNPHWIRKSIGKERTFLQDIDGRDEMHDIIQNLSVDIVNYLNKSKIKGRTITLKVKYFDFTVVTRSITLEKPTDVSDIIMMQARMLLEKTEAGNKKVRLLGVSLSNLYHEDNKDIEDLQLFLPLHE